MVNFCGKVGMCLWRGQCARPQVEHPETSPLLGLTRWRRVILDEAQCIKGRHTKLARKVTRLEAGAKWCVSGTPMQNSVEELFPLLRFLQLEPFCVPSVWKKLVTDPLKTAALQEEGKTLGTMKSSMGGGAAGQARPARFLSFGIKSQKS